MKKRLRYAKKIADAISDIVLLAGLPIAVVITIVNILIFIMAK